MMSLLVFKEQLKAFYTKFDIYINPFIKFVFSLTAFWLMNRNIGFMAGLTGPAAPLVLALACSFLPWGGITFIAGGFMMCHLWSVSLEIALVSLIILLMVALLYYGFRPGDSWILILTPMLFFLKIPYAVPLLVGLSGSLASVIPVSCGVFLYYMMLYVKQNAGVLANDTSVELTQKYVQVIKTVMSNRLMLVMAAAFAISFLVVFLIKNLSMDYAWVVAIISGTIAQLAVIFIGDIMADVTVPVAPLLLGLLASAVIAGIYTFFVFAVDYSRTEYAQFEDDDYYYYVKAVPKMTVSAPDVKVQKINARKPDRNSY